MKEKMRYILRLLIIVMFNVFIMGLLGCALRALPWP